MNKSKSYDEDEPELNLFYSQKDFQAFRVEVHNFIRANGSVKYSQLNREFPDKGNWIGEIVNVSPVINTQIGFVSNFSIDENYVIEPMKYGMKPLNLGKVQKEMVLPDWQEMGK